MMTLHKLTNRLVELLAMGFHAEVVIKAWDAETSSYQPVTGFIHSRDTILLQTDMTAL